MKNKIGLMGGTFNPVHYGHLHIAECFVNELNLDNIILIPNNISPFKQEVSNTILPIHRIKMLELATLGIKNLSIDRYEIDKAGVSYSIDTVKHFNNRFPFSSLYFLIGDDQIGSFKKWKNWEDIVALCTIVIARRTGLIKSAEIEEFTELICSEAKNPPIYLKNDFVDISSSEIRKRIYEAADIKKMLPDDVINYISENNLYK